MKQSHACLMLAAAILAPMCLPLRAADSLRKLEAPGFRPDSALADGFLAHLGDADFSVLPTMIRTRQGTLTSEASQEAVAAFFKEKDWGRVETRRLVLDLGEPEGGAQYKLFQSDLQKIASFVKDQPGQGYFVMVEHLLTPTPSGDIAVGGIHVFLLDAQGRNAFSFLLNTHHRIFREAALRSADAGDDGRRRLIAKATETALAALEQQVVQARGAKRW